MITISQLAKHAGVTVRAVRHYHQIGLLAERAGGDSGFDRAERAADNLSTFRQICRQVGRELGAFPCFMPKPFMGVSANGCHHNISIWRGDENVFLPDTEDQQKPGELGLYAIGGIMAHQPALT